MTNASAATTFAATARSKPRRRMPFPALFLTLTLIGVAGCSDPDPAPTTAPPTATSTAPSPTATPTPTPTPSGPDIPAAARTQDEKGGIAFVKFFIDQVNESYTTPRDDLIPPLSDPGCKSCDELQRYAEQYVASNSHTSAAPYRATNLTWIGEQTAGVFIITMTLKTLPVDTIDSSGKTVSTYPEESAGRRIGITWKEGQWVIYDAASIDS